MPYYFTSESVSEGHPDKVADQISDALIDHFLAFDPQSKVACETLVTTGQVILAGEVKSEAYLDVQQIARDTIDRIGYTKSEYMFDAASCGVLSAIHEQSPDINQGVERAAPLAMQTTETKHTQSAPCVNKMQSMAPARPSSGTTRVYWGKICGSTRACRGWWMEAV